MLASTRTIALISDEDGSQPVEYALLIALVSIVLVLALNDAVSGVPAALAHLAVRVRNCFSSTKGTC